MRVHSKSEFDDRKLRCLERERQSSDISPNGPETTERTENVYIENEIEREISRSGDVSLIIHSGEMSIYLATRDVENREHVRIRIVHANEFRLNGMNNPRCELKRAKITENKDHKDEISPTVMILQNTVVCLV